MRTLCVTRPFLPLVAGIALFALPHPTRAIAPDPLAIVKASAAAYRDARTLTFRMEWSVTVEAGKQPHHTTWSAVVHAEKPNKISVVSEGTGATLTVKSDGKELVTYQHLTKRYTVEDAPATLDDLGQTGTAAGTLAYVQTFLATDPEARFMEDVVAVKYLGNETLDGVPTQRLQATQQRVVLDLWFSQGNSPMLLRMVPKYDLGREGGTDATSFRMELRFSDWKLDAAIPADQFRFTPPEGATKVEDLYQRPEISTDSQTSNPVHKGKPIPCGPDVYTSKRYLKERKVWRTNLIVGGYDKHGSRNPDWDAKARAFLTKAIERFEGNMDEDLLWELHRTCADLLESGCDDPYIIYCHGNLLHYCEGAQYAKPIVQESLGALEQSSYSRLLAYFAANRLSAICRELRGKDDPEAKEMAALSTRHLASAGTEPEVIGENPRFYLDEVRNIWNPLSLEQRDTFIASLDATEGIDPWVVNTLKGEQWIKKAWKSRGVRWAYQVRENEWQEFREGLAKAREHLQTAYDLRPANPEAATSMIAVAKASSGAGQPREWFDRAVAAQLDYLDAYTKLLWALQPSWGGSHREVLGLGAEALATKRFDTNVPWKYMDALHNVAAELGDWREAFRKPGVFEKVKEACDGYSAQPDRQDGCAYRTSIVAVAAWAAGKPKLAKALLDELGDTFNGYWFRQFKVDRETIVTQVDAELGKLGSEAEEAEKLTSQGRLDKAVPLYMTVLLNETLPERQRYAYAKIDKASIRDPLDDAELVVAALGELGLRYRIIQGCRAYTKEHHANAMPDKLKPTLEEVLGPHVLAFMGSMPRERLTEFSQQEVDENLASIAATAQSISRSQGDGDVPRKGTLLDTHAKLAEMRALLHQDMGERAPAKVFREHTSKHIRGRLRAIAHRGWALEQILYFCGERTARYYMKWYLVADCFTQVQLPADRNTKRIRQILEKLAAVENDDQLVSECWEHYWQYGGCRLALEMAQLLRKRGLATPAFLFESKVDTWLQCLNLIRRDSYWSTWASMLTYSWVRGYEDQVVEYAGKSLAKKPADSTYYIAAAALFRKGQGEEAAEFVLKGKDATVDRGPPFPTPEASYGTTAALREALVRSLLEADGVAKATKDRLREACPPPKKK